MVLRVWFSREERSLWTGIKLTYLLFLFQVNKNEHEMYNADFFFRRGANLSNDDIISE